MNAILEEQVLIPHQETETLWHITVLSNLIRGYDKYARVYSKTGIAESTFPDRFFLLRRNEIHFGIAKANSLLERLGTQGNRLVAMRTVVPKHELRENERTGIGRFIERGHIALDGVAWVTGVTTAPQLESVALEEACALSLELLRPRLHPFETLRPRSFSILPVARGCQAACPFCFSEASVSAEQDQARLDLERVRDLALVARNRGAERFVITGGGEPGLVSHEILRQAITIGSETLGKTVLITNGHHVAKRDPEAQAKMLAEYHDAGLRVLAISRHHHSDERNAQIMNFAAFQDFRNALMRERDDVLDGAETNLYRALARLAVPPTSAPEKTVHRCHLASEWAQCFGLDASAVKRALVSCGVRDSLARLFRHYAGQHARLWLPEDNYPVYAELAPTAGLSFGHSQPSRSPNGPTADILM